MDILAWRIGGFLACVLRADCVRLARIYVCVDIGVAMRRPRLECVDVVGVWRRVVQFFCMFSPKSTYSMVIVGLVRFYREIRNKMHFLI